MNTNQHAVPQWRYLFVPAGFAVIGLILVASLIRSTTLMLVVLAYVITCAILDWRRPVRNRWIIRANLALGAIFAFLALYGMAVVADTVHWRKQGDGIVGTIMPGGIEEFRDVCPGADQLEWRYRDAERTVVAYRCLTGNSPFHMWPFYSSGESAELAVRLSAFMSDVSSLSCAYDSPTHSVVCRKLFSVEGCKAIASSDQAVGLPNDCIIAIKNETVDVPGIGRTECNDPTFRGSEKGVVVPRACIEKGITVVRGSNRIDPDEGPKN